MQIDIRLVRPEDAAQIIEYAKIVGAETDCLILDENGMPGLTIEKEADFLRQLPTEHSAMYGAFCGTLPIGIANIQGSNRERIAHRASIGISVRRDYWRQGIGSRLMEALITFAERSPRIAQLELEVRRDNAAALALYRKFGFRIYGEMDRAFKINGVCRGAYDMLLQLDKKGQKP